MTKSTSRLLCFAVTLVFALASSSVYAQGFDVTIGNAVVDLDAGPGSVATSFDITISNPTASALTIAGYSFFVDIDSPTGALPTGVIFDTPAATYFSGQGVPPLIGAPNPGTINFTPAAGDLGLGQAQLGFDGTIAAGDSFDFVSVNLLVDRDNAVAGDYQLRLDPAGQNSISSTTDSDQQFSQFSGVLSLTTTAIPEPSSLVVLGLFQTAILLRRRRK